MPGVANVWQSKNVPVAKPVTPVLKTSIGRVHNYSMHQWTGVSKLHAEGIRGKGATVAIIDTGIDYTHKAVSIEHASDLTALTDAWRSSEAASALVARSLVVTTWLAQIGTRMLRRSIRRSSMGIPWTFTVMALTLLASLPLRTAGKIMRRLSLHCLILC